MSITAVSPSPVPAPDQANAWLARHYLELRSRALACFARRNPEAREEAVAEALALVVIAVHHAARRGVLHRFTPYRGILYASRQVRSGRRASGSCSTDVLAERAQVQRGFQVRSLEQADDGQARRLRESLASRADQDPAEAARRRYDYPRVLAEPRLSAKARATFGFLAATHGQGRQMDLAAQLGVSPGRVSQLKGELARALAAHGYRGPLGARPKADGGHAQRALV